MSEFRNPGEVSIQQKVKEFWADGAWNEPLVRGTLDPMGVPREIIKEVVKIPIDSEGKDTLRWTQTMHKNFTTSSAWEICRRRQPAMRVFDLIWNDCTLPSISIFIWRLLANRVQVDAKLQWRKISLAFKCRCCRAPRIETRDHLFLHGEVAAEVWGLVAAWFPSLPVLNPDVNDIESRIKFWHLRLGHTSRAHVSSIIPCLVLWFIWSQRNGRIHRGDLFNVDSVISRIKQHLQQLISGGTLGREQWSGSVIPDTLDTSTWRVKPRKQVRMVRWIPPEDNWVKLNTNGHWSNGGMRAGGILRDERGSIIRGFMAKICASSSHDAKLQALSLALTW